MIEDTVHEQSPVEMRRHIGGSKGCSPTYTRFARLRELGSNLSEEPFQLTTAIGRQASFFTIEKFKPLANA